ncbi:hypothetical protein EJ05DRAFT_489643 [Pseudovirgaria hyperparasitica]|uniref:Nucleosome assembly protein n=1 Tax=Pseudovirgaria hyperparasitica TaxID=470096 RepID=A0A6A6VWB1_9PEZI|nr:uncharacterized protein EJ05DRAFT_489643 [Pseudovirgaria hyperparasitica]KAF2753930.1 hypothetical protein EJ05DRAFT_489643 [Pseudovirgaria hyperparasitica]
MTKEDVEQTAPDVSYEELAAIEHDFEEAELDIIRATTKRFAPLYIKRKAIIDKIPAFWALVLEQAPPELDQFIQPSDSQVFADALTDMSVSRFEIDDPAGSPRSISITFTFSENEYFTNKTLNKKFWYRRSSEDHVTLVSEPVQIDWKEGKDLTNGLNAAVISLWKARAGAAKGTKQSEIPEFKKLLKVIEQSETDEALSFFTWFSFVSDSRWISAEESAEATKKAREERNKPKVDKKEEEPEMVDAEDLELDILSEVHGAGAEIANIIAEDVWPNAIEYYTQSQFDDEELSELDEDEEMDDDSEGEEVDIRALVGKGKTSNSPPPPKKRKA